MRSELCLATMKGEKPLEGEQNHLQRRRNEEEGDDRHEGASVLSEAPQNQQAGDAKEKEARLHGSWKGRGEDENETCWDGEEPQRQKENQTEQRRDICNGYSKDVSEGKMEKATIGSINVLQSSRFQQHVPLKKRPVNCPTCHADVKLCHCLEHGEIFRWRPEGLGFPIDEKSDKGFKFQNCFSNVGFALNVLQQMYFEEKACQGIESGRSFTEGSGLNRQQQNHTGEKPYIGKECGQGFKQNSHLQIPQRIQTGGKRFECKECGKCFRLASSFKLHQCFHSGEKPFACEVCGKRFTRRCNLAVHQQIHSGEKLYSCKICGKGFSDPSPLKIHRCSRSREKPNHCEERGKRFCPGNDLGIHADEKPYSCKECGKCFGDLSTFMIHQRYHSKEKPVACKECGKRFTRRCNLAVHQQIHSGGKALNVQGMW